MDKAIGSTQVHKGAKVGQTADRTPADLTRTQGFEQFGFLCVPPQARSRSLRQDEALALAVDFDYLYVNVRAYQMGPAFLWLLSVTSPMLRSELGGRYKAP